MRPTLPLVLWALCSIGCTGSAPLLSDRDAGLPGPGISTSSFVSCEPEADGWYAEAELPLNVATVRGLRAVLCDLEGTAPERSGGLPCAITSEVAFSDTVARVACGSGDPAAGGFRYGTVRFVVDP